MGIVRIILAFAVFLSHEPWSGMELIPGHVAVQAFYVVSGFYMSLVLNEKYGPNENGLFWSNRALRLFPCYAVVLVLSTAALAFMNAGIFVDRQDFVRALKSGPWTALPIIWGNIAILGQELLFLTEVNSTDLALRLTTGCGTGPEAYAYMLVPQAWSVSMELYFYFLAPFLVRGSLLKGIGVFVVSLLVRFLALAVAPPCDMLARKFFPAELCLFMLGFFAYRIYRYAEDRSLPPGYGWPALAVVVGTIASWPFVEWNYFMPFLVTVVALCIPFIFRMTKANAVDRFLGELSYTAYMSHFLVIAVAMELFEDVPLWALTLAVFAASVALHLLVDAPVDRMRQRRAKSLSFTREPICFPMQGVPQKADEGLLPSRIP